MSLFAYNDRSLWSRPTLVQAALSLAVAVAITWIQGQMPEWWQVALLDFARIPLGLGLGDLALKGRSGGWLLRLWPTAALGLGDGLYQQRMEVLPLELARPISSPDGYFVLMILWLLGTTLAGVGLVARANLPGARFGRTILGTLAVGLVLAVLPSVPELTVNLWRWVVVPGVIAMFTAAIRYRLDES